MEGMSHAAMRKLEREAAAERIECLEDQLMEQKARCAALSDEFITKREYFAGLAFAQASREIWADHKYEDVAKRAVALADALLAELAKGEQP